MEQKPAVGRIVHFYPATNDTEARTNGLQDGEPLPAVIVRAWKNADGEVQSHVNLKVFTDGEKDIWRTSVELGTRVAKPEDGHYPTVSYWEWPVIK